MLCLVQGKTGLPKKQPVDIAATRVMGVSAAVVTVETGLHPRRERKVLEEAFRRLADLRPRRVVYERGFPYLRAFVEAGFAPAEADLHRYLAPRAAMAACPEGGAVYFYAPRPDRAALEHIKLLRRHFRHLMADLGGGARYSDGLLFEFGLSVIQNPSPERLRDARAALLYAEPDRPIALSPECVALAPRREWLEKVACGAYVSELDVGVKRGKWPLLPESFPPEPLIAAALEAGTLRPEDVTVIRARLCPLRPSGGEAGPVLTNAGSVSII